MGNTPSLTRRLALAAPLILAAGPALAAKARIVTILGDSITAGLGLAAKDALPARLQGELARIGAPATVRGAGVSGDTTGAGLARVDFSVQADTDLCIVALGGNDLLQGLDPKTMKANLEGIVRRLKARRIGALIAGIKAPAAIGKAYAAEFDAVFLAVAKEFALPVYPDLLVGLTGQQSLIQPDGIHPNVTGVSIMVRGLAPVVARALRTAR